MDVLPILYEGSTPSQGFNFNHYLPVQSGQIALWPRKMESTTLLGAVDDDRTADTSKWSKGQQYTFFCDQISVWS